MARMIGSPRIRKMPSLPLDTSTRRKLLADWFAVLAEEYGLRFSQHGSTGESLTLGSPKEFHVKADFVDEPPFLRFRASEATRQPTVDKIARLAADRVENGDLGRGAWYSTELPEVKFAIDAQFSVIGSLLQRLSDQTRILGWRRLGRDVLLEFTERQPESNGETQQRLLAPEALVNVHIFAPGPEDGLFSSQLVHNVVETIGAICTFALGRPVSLPSMIFASDTEQITELSRRRTDPQILTLARRSIGLDIFSYAGVPGGLDVFRRSQSALITYDAALRQQRDPVACVLYVVSAECLTTPNTQWRHARLTKRFIEFFDDLIPEQLDAIVGHSQFETTFEIQRGNRSARSLRRAALDRMYDYRSGQIHSGLAPSYQGFALAPDFSSETRRGLCGDFAEAAILGYLAAPRSSLIGHPNHCP